MTSYLFVLCFQEGLEQLVFGKSQELKSNYNSVIEILLLLANGFLKETGA